MPYSECRSASMSVQWSLMSDAMVSSAGSYHE
jgi:hypothetical protein